MDPNKILPPNIQEKDILKVIGILAGFLIVVVLGTFIFPLLFFVLVLVLLIAVGYIVRLFLKKT